jgi:hypothetical protein
MNKRFTAAAVVLLGVATVVTTVSAQVSYPNSRFTSYQVANLGAAATTIHVDYYAADGTVARAVDYADVPAGGSVTVQQSLESELADGQYSAVISAGEPIAAVANQQLGTDGSGTSIPPFSSYSGAREGATEIMLPSIMYNWFGYYTELVIQNVGDASAVDISIEYFPTTYAGCLAGATGETESVPSIPQYAGTTVSQVENLDLGASGLTDDCTVFNGRFLGSAKITSSEPIVAIVNQHVQDKLFTYNSFAGGTDTLLLPAYMRDYYGYYVALVVANPGGVTATVTITYTNGDQGSTPGDVVVGTHSVPAGENITIYDGPGDAVTDLSPTYPNGDGGCATGTCFFGSAMISSDQPVVAIVNQEALPATGAQAGTYNGMSTAEGSSKVSVPLFQANFYGYYTSLTIMTVDGGEAVLDITYTSDSTYSSVQGHSKTYARTTVNGFLNISPGGGATLPPPDDIYNDPEWQDTAGNRLFIGSAIIEVVSGSNVVAFVNSESSTAPGASSTDSMYTYNAFPIQ